MCFSPKTPKIQQINTSATPPPPPPVETATTMREPDSASSRDSTALTQKRKGRNALRITRDSSNVNANVPATGSGVNIA